MPMPSPLLLEEKLIQSCVIDNDWGISVPDVVKHLNVSRRLAEVRFRAACGLSLLEEIRNARLERVKRLLADTDLTLSEICTRCNYQTDIHLRRLFKARFGCSMRDYRKNLHLPETT